LLQQLYKNTSPFDKNGFVETLELGGATAYRKADLSSCLALVPVAIPPSADDFYKAKPVALCDSALPNSSRAVVEFKIKRRMSCISQ
jgi:hypothetical protein